MNLLTIVSISIIAVVVILIIHDNTSQEAYSHTITFEYSPANVPGLNRDKPAEPAPVTEKDLESVPKIKKILGYLLEAPRYERSELRSLILEDGDPDSYLIVMTGPFSYKGTVFLTDAEFEQYSDFLSENTMIVEPLEWPHYYLFEFKGEVFDSEVGSLDSGTKL